MEQTSQDNTQISEVPELQDYSPPEVGEIVETNEPPSEETPQQEQIPEFEHQYNEEYQHVEQETESPASSSEENANQVAPQTQHKFDPEDIITHNIFVGDLKSDVVEQDLFDAFRPCGEIHSVHIFRDPHTQEQKGFGFVHFMTREAQQKALSDEFRNISIKDRPCRVSLSEQKNTLFVGGLPTDMTEEEISAAICTIIPAEHVVTLELKKGPPPGYDSRGFCFIQFVSHGKADNARRTLAQSTIKGRQLNVAWAETRHSKEPDPDELEKVKTLYVSNLSVTVNEQVLQALFQEHGQVVNCVIVRNQQSKQSRGFAFVEFAERENAITAQGVLNGYELSGQNILVVLAKPMVPKKNEKVSGGPVKKGHNKQGGGNHMGNQQYQQNQQRNRRQHHNNNNGNAHMGAPNTGYIPPPPPPHQVYNPSPNPRGGGNVGGRGGKMNRGGRGGGGNMGSSQGQRFAPYQNRQQQQQQQPAMQPGYPPQYANPMQHGMYAQYQQGYSMPANMAAYYSQPYQQQYAQYQQQYAAAMNANVAATSTSTTKSNQYPNQQQQQQMAYYQQQYYQQ